MEQGTDNEDVLLRRDGHLGHIILNRPQTVNALTHTRVTRIAAALNDWEHNDAVATILLTGAGERGLCAGDDIGAIRRDAVNNGTGTERFWADEYRRNARISNYPKPNVAVMDASGNKRTPVSGIPSFVRSITTRGDPWVEPRRRRRAPGASGATDLPPAPHEPQLRLNHTARGEGVFDG